MNKFIILAVLLSLSAFFSAAETALTAISKHNLHHWLAKKIRGAKKLAEIKDQPGMMLAAILIGNTLVNISIASIATMLFMEYFKKIDFTNEIYTTAIITFVTTFVVLVFGEITPKTIAMSYNKAFALRAAPLIAWLIILLKPFVYLFNKFSNLVIRLFGGHPLHKDSLVTEEEIMSFLEAGAATGAINSEEKKMMHEVIRFGDTLVGEVMTHWDNVVALSDQTTIEQTLEQIKNRLKSRIPIYAGKNNNVVGFLYVKDLIKKLPEYATISKHTLREHPELIRPHVITYIDQKTTDILKQLRFHKVHIAIVNNRENKTVGIITIEDLIEEIVGEISDEYETI